MDDSISKKKTSATEMIGNRLNNNLLSLHVVKPQENLINDKDTEVEIHELYEESKNYVSLSVWGENTQSAIRDSISKSTNCTKWDESQVIIFENPSALATEAWNSNFFKLFLNQESLILSVDNSTPNWNQGDFNFDDILKEFMNPKVSNVVSKDRFSDTNSNEPSKNFH